PGSPTEPPRVCPGTDTELDRVPKVRRLTRPAGAAFAVTGSAEARRLAAAVGLGLAVGWPIGNVGAVADRLAGAYDVRLALIGVLTTVLFLVQTATQVPAGRAIDRLGAPTVGLAALAVIALGDVICLAGKIFWLAALGRAVTGLGTGSAFICGTDFARGTPLRQGIYGGSSVGGVGI